MSNVISSIFPHADALRTATQMAINEAHQFGRPVGDEDMIFFNSKLKYYKQLLEGWKEFEAKNGR